MANKTQSTIVSVYATVNKLYQRKYDVLDENTQRDIDDLAGADVLVWQDLVNSEYRAMTGGLQNTAAAKVAPKVNTPAELFGVLTYPNSDQPLVNKSGQPVAHKDIPASWTAERFHNSPVRGTMPTSLAMIASASNKTGGQWFSYNQVYSLDNFQAQLANVAAVNHDIVTAVNKHFGGKAAAAEPKARLEAAMVIFVAQFLGKGKYALDAEKTSAPKITPKDTTISLPAKNEDTAELAALQAKLEKARQMIADYPDFAAVAAGQIADIEKQIAALSPATIDPEKLAWQNKAHKAYDISQALNTVIDGKELNAEQIETLAALAKRESGYLAYCNVMATTGDKEAARAASKAVTGDAQDDHDPATPKLTKLQKHTNFLTGQKAIIREVMAMVANGTPANDAKKAVQEKYSCCGCVYGVEKTTGTMSARWQRRDSGCDINKAEK